MHTYEIEDTQTNFQMSQNCSRHPREPHKSKNLSKGDGKAKQGMSTQKEGINKLLMMEKWARSGQKAKDQQD